VAKKPPKLDVTIIEEVLQSTGVALDALPYAQEFEHIFAHKTRRS